MEFQYLLYKKRELSQHGSLPKELCELFLELNRHGITEAEVDTTTFSEYMHKNKILPKSVLIIAATDETLKEAANLQAAALAYKNPDFPSEELYQADYLAEGFLEIDFDFLVKVYQRKHGIPWRALETKRCYLREMTISDLPDLYQLYEGQGMTEYMEPLYDLEKEMEYASAYILHMYRYYGYGMWLVKDRATDELIGRAGFSHYEPDGECLLEMGYAIAVSHQRKGYATEICQALIEYAQNAKLGFDGLYCFVQEGNQASSALLNKLGFVFQKVKFREGKKMRQYFFCFNHCNLAYNLL